MMVVTPAALLDQENQEEAIGGADGGKQEERCQHGGNERELQRLLHLLLFEGGVACLLDAVSTDSGTQQW